MYENIVARLIDLAILSAKKIRLGIVILIKRTLTWWGWEEQRKNRAYKKLFIANKRIVNLWKCNPIAAQIKCKPIKDILIGGWQSNKDKLEAIFDIENREMAAINTRQTKVLVLAAGEGVRWEKHHLKQLAIVNNRPLIEHILHELPQAVVVTHRDELKVYPSITPLRHEYVLETILSTQHLWGERTIILLGDTLYDPKDMNTILEYNGEFSIFGSSTQVEIFAVSFTAVHKQRLLQHLYEALLDAYTGGRGKIWDMYHSHEQMPLYKVGIGDNFIELLGTTDIDSVEDYEALIHHKPFKNYLAKS